MVFTFDFDFGSGVFCEQNTVTSFDLKRMIFAVDNFSTAYWYDLSFHGFFLCGIWNDDSAFGLFFFRNSFDKNSVVKWFDLHDVFSFLGVGVVVELSDFFG